jgi:FAD:protein FMN transferase
MPTNTRPTYSKTTLFMDTAIRIKIVTDRPEEEVAAKMSRAFDAFRFTEQVCSRFTPQSEVRRLCAAPAGTPVPMSPLLYEAIRLACTVAADTDGAFDPTMGRQLEQLGFRRHYLTGEEIESDFASTKGVSYHDIMLDDAHHTVLLRQPLLLDLGAVAKGMAVDLAVKELSDYDGFLVDAGGDLYAGGLNEREEPWRIGIQHPQRAEETVCTLQVTDAAVCTSGSYERVSPVQEKTHHLLDPRTGASPQELLSCSVVAPFTMLADPYSTAAFILGVKNGLPLLERLGLEGLMITSSLDLHQTNEMKRYLP